MPNIDFMFHYSCVQRYRPVLPFFFFSVFIIHVYSINLQQSEEPRTDCRRFVGYLLLRRFVVCVFLVWWCGVV